MFSKEIPSNKNHYEWDGEKRIGVAHFGFREYEKPEDDAYSIEKKSSKKRRIQKESYANPPDVLMGSEPPSSALPENLGDTVECSRKE